MLQQELLLKAIQKPVLEQSILPSVHWGHAAESMLHLCSALAVNAGLHAVDVLVVVCSLPDAQEFCFSKLKGCEDGLPFEGLCWEKLDKSSSFILGAACSVSVRWNQTALQCYRCLNQKERLLIFHPFLLLGVSTMFCQKEWKKAKEHHMYFSIFSSFTVFNPCMTCSRKIWGILKMKCLKAK